MNRKTTLTVAALAAALAGAPAATAQRSGKEVVESACAACHARGEQGAPKLGDNKAWRKRSVQGLRSLTQSALKGIRNIPAHAGNAQASDLEIARAIAYMVNQAGGKWPEPGSLHLLAAERTGPQVVNEQCAQCHEAGRSGAPKAGNVAAWRPRLRNGLDKLVAAAMRGHGGMPPRGSRADLTEGEARHAVLTMITPPPGPAPKGGAPERIAAPASLYRSVGGLEVHMAVVPAETMRLFPEGSPEHALHGGVPGGRGFYHLSVSLADAASKAPIRDAKVAVRLELPGTASASSTLEPTTINGKPSHGAYLRMRPKSDYRVVVQVQRRGAPAPVDARFEHRTR